MTKMTKSRRIRSWPLADAKAHLSDLVSRASTDGPQQITRHGRPEAVVLSFEDWRRLSMPRQGLVAFLRAGLAGLELERDADTGRDVEL